MDKIKQKTSKHEAQSCWNNYDKTHRVSLFFLYYQYDIKFRDFKFRVSYISRVLNFAISRSLVLAKLSENKVIKKQIRNR